MEQVTALTIQCLDTITPPWHTGEYEDITHFREGICRCFHNHNNHVQVACGNKEIMLELYPDFEMVYEEFPDLLKDIKQGKECFLDFPESGYEITFTSVNHLLVVCTIRQYGYAIGEWTRDLEKSQVVTEIRSFVLSLLERAKKDNYITPEEAQDYSERMDGIMQAV